MPSLTCRKLSGLCWKGLCPGMELVPGRDEGQRAPGAGRTSWVCRVCRKAQEKISPLGPRS